MKFYTCFLLLQTHKKCANIFLHQKQTIFWFCKLLKPCLAAAHVEILNSGSRSKVGAEIQKYPNTEMLKCRKAEMRIFGLWGYIIISHFRFKGKRQGWGAEIPEKFLILGNYWQWILLAKWLLRKRLVPFFWTSTAVSHICAQSNDMLMAVEDVKSNILSKDNVLPGFWRQIIWQWFWWSNVVLF